MGSFSMSLDTKKLRAESDHILCLTLSAWSALAHPPTIPLSPGTIMTPILCALLSIGESWVGEGGIKGTLEAMDGG